MTTVYLLLIDPKLYFPSIETALSKNTNSPLMTNPVASHCSCCLTSVQHLTLFTIFFPPNLSRILGSHWLAFLNPPFKCYAQSSVHSSLVHRILCLLLSSKPQLLLHMYLHPRLSSCSLDEQGSCMTIMKSIWSVKVLNSVSNLAPLLCFFSY